MESQESGNGLIRKTSSICPQCNKVLDAEVFERGGKVFISKNCPEHGMFEDLYFGSYEMYKKFEKFAHEGTGIENPNTKGEVCPNSCGMCRLHKSGTALANIMLTNRCDLSCWYCFAYAKKDNYVYEPTKEQIREMLVLLRNEKPVPPTAIQFTGGEPTLREDLIEIIKMAKGEGFRHVQLNTNGINLSKSPSLAMDIKRAGVNTIYLSFDGVTEQTNPKNHWEIPKILQNCREAGIGIVLVPTVIKGVNDHEIGAILRFGFRNIDVVRGINFQPVSLVGRMPREEREKRRITIPDVIERLEEQTGGEVRKSDFYPVPTVVPITHLVEAIKGKPQYEFSCLPFCGAATYIFREGNGSGSSKLIPITRFVEVENLLDSIENAAKKIGDSKIKTFSRLVEVSKLAAAIRTMIDEEKEPEDLDLSKILKEILIERGSYHSLGELHHRALFVGMMHFQDKYNYDIQRVQRCVIHYATPDNRIIPFCAFNVIPELYRDAIQKKYSVPVEEWEMRAGRKLEGDFYKRDAEKLKSDPEYAKAYGISSAAQA
jgi:uncharacterized radical SAM superfamily Fe-S cluster-containing enzyme